MANTKLRARAGAKLQPRIIAADSDLHDGVRALRRKCAIMRRVHDFAGHPPLRRRPGGFEGLARIVVGQQVSVASATAIWGRTAAACTPFEPHILLALDDKASGRRRLSRGKIRTLRAIATACRNGLDFTRLDSLSEEEVHDALTEIYGYRTVDRRRLHPVLPRPRRRLGAGRPRPAGRGPARLRAGRASRQGGDAGAGRALAALARRRRPPAVGLLRSSQAAAHGRAGLITSFREATAEAGMPVIDAGFRRSGGPVTIPVWQ